MANQEHVKILKQGVAIWNEWREDNPDVKPDFSESDLRGTDLRGTNLSRADLSGADLKEADITGSNLSFTARDEWKIDGIKCDYVFWDKTGEFRTPKDRDFRTGEFENLYRWRPLNNFERLIERSIEFPPEYKQAGVSILNYFGEILRKKYPESEATVQIKQDGLKVTMTIDPADGEREVIEKTLNDYGLVITGKMTLEEYAGNNPLMILELKSELRSAYHKIQLQKELIKYQEKALEIKDNQIEKILSVVGDALKPMYNIKLSSDNIGKDDIVFAKDQAFVMVNEKINKAKNIDEKLSNQLNEMIASVEEMIQDIHDNKAKEIISDLDTLVNEVIKDEPRYNWCEVSGKGLIEAAKNFGSLGKPVIEIVQAVLEPLR